MSSLRYTDGYFTRCEQHTPENFEGSWWPIGTSGAGDGCDLCESETPLDRNIREVEEAWAELKAKLHDCRTNGASPEEIKRYVIAHQTLLQELQDLSAYSENR